MSWYHVVLAVARGAKFDTGQRITRRVLAKDLLDAAIRAEAEADALLQEPLVEYTHARTVRPIDQNVSAMAMAA